MDNWGEEIERELSMAIEVMGIAEAAGLDPQPAVEIAVIDTQPAVEIAVVDPQPAEIIQQPAEIIPAAPQPAEIIPAAPQPAELIPTAQPAEVIPAAQPAFTVTTQIVPTKILQRSKAMCDPRNTDEPHAICTGCTSIREKVTAHEQVLRRLRHEVAQCNDVVARFELILAQTVQRVDADLARVEAAHNNRPSPRWNTQQPPTAPIAIPVEREGYRPASYRGSPVPGKPQPWQQKPVHHWKQHGGAPPPAPLATTDRWEWAQDEHPYNPEKYSISDAAYKQHFGRDRPPSNRGGQPHGAKERRGALVYPAPSD